MEGFGSVIIGIGLALALFVIAFVVDIAGEDAIGGGGLGGRERSGDLGGREVDTVRS